MSARLGLRPVDRELEEGVPDWLVGPLLDWLEGALTPDVAKAVALYVRVDLLKEANPVLALRQVLQSRAVESDAGRYDLLDAIDYLINIDFHELMLPEEVTPRLEPVRGSDQLSALDGLLARGGSAYRITSFGRRLERRVDATVGSAFNQSIQTASDEASVHLRIAWSATYGRDPDPDKAYGEAVRAVEAVACPLVLPNDRSRTLGRVIGELRKAGESWDFALAGTGQVTGVTPLIAMLEVLWTGHRSRHSGGPDTRAQSQREAEAAVHLAATLVQWLTTGILRRTAAPTSD